MMRVTWCTLGQAMTERPSAPYDGTRFHIPNDTEHGSFGAFLRWRASRRPGPWQRVQAAPGPPPPARVDRGSRVTFVNHATVLIQMDGLNLLTDPIWSEHAVGSATP